MSIVFKKWEVITITCPCIFTLSSEKSSYPNLFSWFLSLDQNCRQHQETSANWINIYLTCYMNPHIFITDLASMARSRYVIFFYMHISCLSPLNKVTFNWFWVAWARLHFPFAIPFKRLPRRLNFQKNISWQYQNEVAFTRLVSKGTSNGHWRKGMRSADSSCF